MTPLSCDADDCMTASDAWHVSIDDAPVGEFDSGASKKSRRRVGRQKSWLSHISLESGEAENDKGYETTSSCTTVDYRDMPGTLTIRRLR